MLTTRRVPTAWSCGTGCSPDNRDEDPERAQEEAEEERKPGPGCSTLPRPARSASVSLHPDPRASITADLLKAFGFRVYGCRPSPDGLFGTTADNSRLSGLSRPRSRDERHILFGGISVRVSR